MLFLQILVLVICIEATTNIISKSQLFEPLRQVLFESNNRGCKFAHNLIDCPYCTSLWVSLFYTIMFVLYMVNLLPSIFLWFFVAVALHRASNVLHFVIDRVDEYHTIIPED